MTRAVRIALGVGAMSVSLAAVASAATVHYQKTTSFAGYDFSSTRVATASARFTIPTITCSPKNSGVGPGAFVITTRRTSTGLVSYLNGAGLIVACQGNSPSYQLATAVAGKENNSATVKPGDVILVQVHMGSHQTSVLTKDLTTNQTATQSGGGAKPAYVSIGTAGVEQNGVQFGVDKFSTVTFTDVIINGHPLAWWKPAAVERYRVESRTQVIQIRPSAIAHGGESFTLSFVHA
jgi:hypothetical protein